MKKLFATVLFAASPVCFVLSASGDKFDNLYVYLEHAAPPAKYDEIPEIKLVPDFESDIYDYTLHLPYGTDGITIIGRKFGLPPTFGISLNGEGPTEFKQDIYTGEQGAYKVIIAPLILENEKSEVKLAVADFIQSATYTINIYKSNERSSNADLAHMELSFGILSPAFNKEQSSYNALVPGDTLQIHFETDHPGATVKIREKTANGQPIIVDGHAVKNLAAGKNTINIDVISEDGTTNTYSMVAETTDKLLKVEEGDKVEKESDCDFTKGCLGTLNGKKGVLVCTGDDFTFESKEEDKMKFSLNAKGVCILGMDKAGTNTVVSSVGWYFGAFI